MSDNVLHVYGQNYEHDNVVIIGNKSALKHLRDVIKIALKRGKYENTHDYSDFIDGAGEEYDILIFRTDKIDENWLPYTEFKKLDKQLFDVELALEEYEDDPKKCIEEIKKILKEG